MTGHRWLACAVLLCLPNVALAQGTGFALTLSKLTGVQVVVESIRPDLEQLGVSVKNIQTDAELALRRAGVPVLTAQDSNPTFASLQIVLNGISSSGIYAVSLDVNLMQKAFLPRHPLIPFLVRTWNASSVELVGENNVGSIREAVRDLVNQFVNDYLRTHR